MSDWIETSERVRAICDEHWNPPQRRCASCPLHADCPRPVGRGRDAINEHTVRLNTAAERLQEVRE